MSLDRIEDAIEDIAEGKIVIVVDEEDRENEGDLTMAAEKVTPESINFMATHGRGLICMPMTEERLDKLQIPLMVVDNRSVHGTAFCISIEARHNVSTGISAADRATTILAAINSRTDPEDLIQPGHIFPLRARPGGVLERAGQTEAAVDLARIAGLNPAGVICEIMNEDGTMARLPDLTRFAAKHNVRVISVVDLIRFRLRTERFVRRIESVPFESEFGEFQLHLFESDLDGDQHIALVKGDMEGNEPPLVRVHTQSVLSDVFLTLAEGTGRELRRSLEIIDEEGNGVLVYLRLKEKEARLLDEVRRHQKKAKGEHTSAQAVSFKDYGIGCQILADLGLNQIRVLTNHPKKIVGLEGFGLNIAEQIPIDLKPSVVD